RVADPDALLESGIVDVVGFGIENIDQVLVVDRESDPARHSKLIPPREKLSILIEYLNSSVLSVADKDPASLVHRDAVRRAELAGRIAGLAPGLDELALLRELHDAIVGAVAVCNENIAVGRRHDTGGRSEMILVVSGHPGFPERHQHPSIRAELAHEV